ncbi:hypothetical protein I4U23_010264 [Adineta vaga]|nr:hypothetical protein I4U23_010264 [Adineta vaga]
MDPADDLKAFERRMIEIISTVQPSTWRWRILLFILILTNLITFSNLISHLMYSSFAKSSITTTSTEFFSTQIIDVNHSKSYFSIFLSNILRNDISFVISFSLLLFAFLYGIHNKISTSSTIITRIRSILADYNMSCDSDGRLILKPRPTMYFNGGS